MIITPETEVGEIVRLNFKTAQLFDENSIDFCCGGSATIFEACHKSGVDIGQLIPQLELLTFQRDPDSQYIDSLGLDELCDYIEKRHHSYVAKSLPFIQQNLQKLCEVHGENHSELFEVKQLFDEAAGNLTTHMQKEELVLFPYVKKLVREGSKPVSLAEGVCKAEETIETMLEEHQAEGDRFEKISRITNQYTCPPDGCSTFRVTYQSLQDFGNDLHRHIHLENNILFKKAVLLEKGLF